MAGAAKENRVDFEVRPDGVAVVTLVHPPMNTLTNAVQLGLEDAAERLAADKSIVAVVLRGGGSRAFCAGADLPDLNRKHARTPKRAFMECFEDVQVPVVAAIQGFALGGGLELSLGCHYRVLASNAMVGLPEVNVGLLPGGQGTQRLPRLTGAERALSLMLSGAHVPAPMALKMGVADLVVEPEKLLEAAVEFAKERARSNPGNNGRRIKELPCPAPAPEAIAQAKREMAAKRRGQPAPQLIIECVEAACSQPFAEGIQTEQRLFRKLVGSREANALQHVFFSERAAAKVPGLKAKPVPVRKVGIIGSGLMAGGIMMAHAERGIQVVMLDREQKYLDKGLEVVKGHWARSVKRGSKSQATVDKALARCSTTTSYDDLRDVDVVIEAVFEDMVLKKEIFSTLDKVCKPGCVIASNTSYLSIDTMAAATSRPGDVIGMHFFSPANVMPLLEVVRGSQTSPAAIATAMALGSRIGKWSVLVGNCHGFVANRMMEFYGIEARRMVMEGASPEQIDAVAAKFGMPLGPIAMNDLTGLAIGYEARKRKGLVDTQRNVVDWLIENGRLGMKTGKGWYDYGPDRKPKPNAEVQRKIEEVRRTLGIAPRKLSEQEIQQRLFFPVINEGFKILEEGIATRPADIDVVLVHGYNWPRVSGGPMRFADDEGLSRILTSLEELAKAHPSEKYFQPAQLLRDCVAANKPLSAFWQTAGTRARSKI